MGNQRTTQPDPLDEALEQVDDYGVTLTAEERKAVYEASDSAYEASQNLRTVQLLKATSRALGELYNCNCLNGSGKPCDRLKHSK